MHLALIVSYSPGMLERLIQIELISGMHLQMTPCSCTAYTNMPISLRVQSWPHSSTLMWRSIVLHRERDPVNFVSAHYSRIYSRSTVLNFSPATMLMGAVGLRNTGNLHAGPSDINTALRSLGPHKFCAQSPTDLCFN